MVRAFSACCSRARQIRLSMSSRKGMPLASQSFEYMLMEMKPCVVFIFFFQAEDGIRDDLVTGVQTCALPIWPRSLRRPQARRGGPGKARSAGKDRALHAERGPLPALQDRRRAADFQAVVREDEDRKSVV